MTKDFFFRDGRFKLLQLADTHLDFIGDGAPETKTLRLISEALEDEKPDLTVMTGDLVSSELSARNMKYFCDFMDERKAYWAFCFGNHDAEFGASAQALEAIMLSSKYCVYEHGDPAVFGFGNYSIKVYSSENRLRWVLYFLDTGAYLHGRKELGYDYIKGSQIEWYVNERKKIEAGETEASSLFFMHLPLPEHVLAARANPDDIHPYPERKTNTNSGLFAAIKQDRRARGIFCGHLHKLDFCEEYDGVRLGFGRVTGFSCGGRGSSPEGFPIHGCRVIELNQSRKPDFETRLYLDKHTDEL